MSTGWVCLALWIFVCFWLDVNRVSLQIVTVLCCCKKSLLFFCLRGFFVGERKDPCMVPGAKDVRRYESYDLDENT